MEKLNFAFSFDIDWASDEVLDYALTPLVKGRIPMTLFCTHLSQWIEKEVDKSIVEKEIHPNFCANSTQGNTYQEVFDYCEKIPSDRIGFRNHRYFESNDINDIFLQKGYKYSSNICTDMHYVMPFYNRYGFLTIPIFMEDGGFLFQKHVLNLNTIIDRLPKQGTIVFNFHPMHIAFNSNSLAKMKNFRADLSIQDYQNLSMEVIHKKQEKKFGIKDLLSELIEWGDKHNISNILLKSMLK